VLDFRCRRPDFDLKARVGVPAAPSRGILEADEGLRKDWR
jgi:hypothetical protein